MSAAERLAVRTLRRVADGRAGVNCWALVRDEWWTSRSPKGRGRSWSTLARPLYAFKLEDHVSCDHVPAQASRC